MKADRLPSSRSALTAEAGERARTRADETIWHIAEAEGSEADRGRSLNEELADFEVQAVGDFAGRERIRRNARELALQFAALGADAGALVRTGDGGGTHLVDTEA